MGSVNAGLKSDRGEKSDCKIEIKNSGSVTESKQTHEQKSDDPQSESNSADKIENQMFGMPLTRMHSSLALTLAEKNQNQNCLQ